MKNLLTLAILFCNLFSNAQISIVQSDLPSVGDRLIYGVDLSARIDSLEVGAAAGNQLWDFRNLEIDGFDTLNFVDPQNSIFGSLFPNSNLALESQRDFVYFSVDSTAFKIDGLATQFEGVQGVIPVDLNPDQTVFDLPAQFQDNFTTTVRIDSTIDSTFAFFDSLRLSSSIVTNTNFDAWGTLISHAGSFDALRASISEIRIDTIFGHNSLAGWQQLDILRDTVMRLQWYGKGLPFTIAEIEMDAQGNRLEASYQLGDRVAAEVNVVPSCFGSCTGMALATPANGVAPFTYQWDAAAGGQTSPTASDICPGTYTLIISDAQNTSDTISFTITENPEIQIVLTADAGTGSGASINAQVAGGVPPYTYAWSNSSTTSSLSALSSGTYALTVTDNQGCSATDSVSVVATNIDESIQSNTSIRIYPNPSEGLLFIEQLNQNTSATSIPYSIYNLQGTSVLSGNMQVNQVLDLTELGNGVYWVQLQLENKTVFEKLVINR